MKPQDLTEVDCKDILTETLRMPRRLVGIETEKGFLLLLVLLFGWSQYSAAFRPFHARHLHTSQNHVTRLQRRTRVLLGDLPLTEEVVIDHRTATETSQDQKRLLQLPGAFSDLEEILRYHFSDEEVAHLSRKIDSIVEGDLVRSLVADFLAFLLDIGERTDHDRVNNAFATVDIMLGAAVHVSDNAGTSHIDNDQLDLSHSTRQIAAGASKIERAEILVRRYIGAHRIITVEEASRIRGLLVSVMDDWRALAIRCVASLYRLKMHGAQTYSEYQKRPQPLHRAAKEALRVYAPIAQMLGLSQLKEEIQDCAFLIAYPRQYKAAHGLYKGNVQVISALARYLENHVATKIQANQILMHQLEYFHISSRVKKPFSSWAKLLRNRFKRKRSEEHRGELSHRGQSTPESDGELSLVQIHDIVALRVILKARKLNPNEPNEVTQDRERLLCYLIQDYIQREFPEIKSRKDYIDNPKTNGYQSLHFTASISQGIKDWQFEVQVRSEEMHENAEFGVAAHWNYKLNPGKHTLALVGSNPLEVYKPRKSYIDALVWRKEEIASVSFVFVAVMNGNQPPCNGQLVCVPAHEGKVQDVLRDAGVLQDDTLDRLQSSSISILRNGSIASLEEVVSNGDVLLVGEKRMHALPYHI